MKLTPILQLSATECGIASLAMVCAYYGLHIELDELRERCGTSRDGVRASTLMTAAEALGLQASAYRVELDTISKLKIPVIAYWRFNHYVVIKKVKRNKIYINDPACGSLIVSLADFDQCFTGIIIVFEPSAQFKPRRARAKWRPMLRAWLAQRVHALCFVMLCTLLTLLIPVWNARIYAIFVDYCLLGRQHEWLPVLALLTLFALIILIAAARLLKEVQFRLSMQASIMQSARLMQHLLKMPLLYFSLRQKPELTALLMRAEAAAASLFKSLGAAFANVITAILALITLFYIDSQLSLWLLGMFLIYAIPLTIGTRMSADYEQSNIVANGRYYSDLLSGIKCCETIKACGVESSVLAKWQTAMQQKMNALDLTRSLYIILQFFYQSFNSLTMLVTIAVGAMRVADGAMTLGGLMAFYSLQLFFTSQLFALQQLTKEWQTADAMQIRMNDLLAANTDLRFTNSSIPALLPSSVILQCENVSFHYQSQQPPILSGINLTLHAGSVVGFTGATGSGKSTLIKILAHLYPPSAGKIYLYGQDCQRGCAALMPEMFAYVSQESSLFSGTIYENLSLGLPQVSPAVIEAALQDTCLTELIQTRGLHGRVEENGSNFSGGERQRLEIARALIQSARMLILDEATASLDEATEAIILRHLRQRKITILMIAHRLTTLKDCDCIYVLHQGRLVEQGQHNALMAQQSHYYDLVQAGRRVVCTQ